MSVCSLHPHGYPQPCSKMAAEAPVITLAFQARGKGARKKGKKDSSQLSPSSPSSWRAFLNVPPKKLPLPS